MAKAASIPRAHPDTWMPIFWGDYHRDTGHLNAAQHGFYLLLIGHYWSTGQPLPDDDNQLWRIARADSIQHWKKNRAIIAAFFKVIDSLWRHTRIDREMGLASMRQAKAKHAAGKRWASPEHGASGDAQSMLGRCPGDALHNSSSSPPDNSVPNGTASPRSAKEQIFREYLPWLSERAGRDCRSIVGSLCSNLGDDDALETLRICRVAEPQDPVGWINARLRPRETNDQRKDREIREAIERSKLQ